MGKERVHAGLRRWWIEDELSLPVLLRNGVEVIHDNRSVRISISRDSRSKHREIRAERQNCGA